MSFAKAIMLFLLIAILVLFGANYYDFHFSSDDLFAQADAKADANECADSIPLYDRAIECGAGSPGYAKRGICLLRLRRYDDALKDWTGSSKIDPTNPRPHLLRANLLQQMGQPDQALQAYDQAAAVGNNGLVSRLLAPTFCEPKESPISLRLSIGN